MPSKNPLNHSIMNYLYELVPHLWWTSQPGAWWGKIPILDPPSTWCWSGCPGPQAVWKTTVAKLHRDSQPHTIGSRGYQNVFQGDFWMVNRIYQNVNQPPINQGIVSPLQFLWISVEIKGQKWNPENLVTKKWQVLTHTIRNIQIGQIMKLLGSNHHWPVIHLPNLIRSTIMMGSTKVAFVCNSCPK